MRYYIVEIKIKKQKVSIKCLDTQEQVWLKISLDPETLECTDKLIPDSLQSFVQLNEGNIRKYLTAV